MDAARLAEEPLRRPRRPIRRRRGPSSLETSLERLRLHDPARLRDPSGCRSSSCSAPRRRARSAVHPETEPRRSGSSRRRSSRSCGWWIRWRLRWLPCCSRRGPHCSLLVLVRLGSCWIRRKTTYAPLRTDSVLDRMRSSPAHGRNVRPPAPPAHAAPVAPLLDRRPSSAERLEVTSRTLRRDVDRLRSLGYPVHSTSGRGGRLSPRRWHRSYRRCSSTTRRRWPVSLGLRTAAAGSVTGMEEVALRALTKLEQVLPTRLRRRLSALHAAIIPLAPQRSHRRRARAGHHRRRPPASTLNWRSGYPRQ